MNALILETPIFANIVMSAINILYAALGLGLVIFFHELGHFAVAKWCKVQVPRFSIGFGPVIWSFKKGETEYALSLLPFGGYVQMHGQDDMDPSQLSSEEMEKDPHSFASKTVPQRMAIMSAGVIMNVVTGTIFFALAVWLGVQEGPSTVGHVRTGSPAWQAGIRTGDTIEQIDDRKITSFADITRGVALSRGDVEISGTRRDGSSFGPLTITPDGRGTRRIIGVGPAYDASVAQLPEGSDARITSPGTAAAKAEPGFEPSDTIKKLDGEDVPNFGTLQWWLAEKRGKRVVFSVQRAQKEDAENQENDQQELVEITVESQQFRTLGLSMDIGEIAAIQINSPAERAGLKTGDKITHVNGVVVGSHLNPLQLPDQFEQFCRERKTVVLKVLRKDGGKEPEQVTVAFNEKDVVVPGWIDRPSGFEIPLSIPSLGAAIHILPNIVAVKPDSPAAKADIKKGERVRSITFTLIDEDEPDGFSTDKPLTIDFEKTEKSTGNNWAYAFWTMQMTPTRDVLLTVVDADGDERVVPLSPMLEKEWFLPTRGFLPGLKFNTIQISEPIGALLFAGKRSRTSIVDIYLTLSSLFGGRLSVKNLSGPVQIAKIAHRASSRGFSTLLMFLGFLSINLAVLNFLPIPVLDGGHMVFLCWEAITRKKPNKTVRGIATFIGIAFIIGLMGFVLYLDIFIK